MNFHSDEEIMRRVKEHYTEALNFFPEERIVGIFYQGSGNYGLDTEFSDVDTKLVIIPSLEEIVRNEKPVSTTYIRENTEHIDFKDVRLMIQTFKKQNPNFLEILFTKYRIVNPMYEPFWDRLVNEREAIAHYNRYAAIKSLIGVGEEKYFAMEHPYPSKIEILDRYGYDPKQLHHLLRMVEFVENYLDDKSYEGCLQTEQAEYLKKVKLGLYDIVTARRIAEEAHTTLRTISGSMDRKSTLNQCDEKVAELLLDVQYQIVENSLRRELVSE